MFSLPVRLAPGADAIGAERNTGPRAARTVAIGAAEAFWLARIAALCVSWAMSCGLTGSSRAARSQERPASSVTVLQAPRSRL
jgi:hypothetical protein